MSTAKTGVFISWSGNLSKKLAKAIDEWLPYVNHHVETYFTPEDIEKGAKWMSDISGELERSNIGIICLTSDNLNNPWILFEAGALSKNLERSRVCTLLFNLEPADVKGPLALFQATRFTKEDMRKLLATINNACGDSKLEEERLNNVFEKWWPDLEQGVTTILASHQPAYNGTRRSPEDMIEEILELTRAHVKRDADRIGILPWAVTDDPGHRSDDLLDESDRARLFAFLANWYSSGVQAHSSSKSSRTTVSTTSTRPQEQPEPDDGEEQA